MEICIELKVLMTRAGLNGKALAEQTKMSKSKISKILNGRQVPTWSEVSAISISCGYEPMISFQPLNNWSFQTKTK